MARYRLLNPRLFNPRLFNPRLFIPLVAAVVLAIAVACGSSATSTPQATIVPTSTPSGVPTAAPSATGEPAMSEDAKYGGDISMGAYADTRDWDPLGSASLSSVQALSQIYNQIVQYDTVDTTKIVGDLATSWDVTNGGETFTFHLAENAKWHNGTDLTAADVVASMSRYMDPENSIGRSGLFRSYTKPVEEDGIKLIDDHTVEFNLTFPSGAFIRFLALDYSKVLQKGLLDQGIDLNQAENIIENGGGSGPFVLDAYQRGNSYQVSKNEDYFKEGRPFFDSISHFIITDTGTLIAQFKAGQLDMMNGGFSNLSPTEYVQLDEDTKGTSNGHVIAHELPGTRNWGLMINRKVEPFTDPRIRKAIYLAIDRNQINDLLEDGTGDIPCGLMGMGYDFAECATWPGIRDKNSAGGEADLAFAKQLMADAGFPDGFQTKYDARRVGNYPDVCSVVKQQLNNTLGIDGEIGVHESAAGYSLFATARAPEAIGDWELACQGEGMTVIDPDGLLGSVYVKGATRNYTDWESDFVNAKFEEQKVETDPAKRREILKEIEDFLVPTNPDDISQGFNDNHWVTLYWGKFFWLVHEDIRGFNTPQTVQYGFKHEDLWLDR